MIIGIGCDIVKIERIKQMIDKGFSKKLLTENEFNQWCQLNQARQAEWLAGRFAAKEAVFKALPSDVVKTIFAVEIRIENDKPIALLPNDISLKYQIHLSISHEKEYAIAYAICEQKKADQ